MMGYDSMFGPRIALWKKDVLYTTVCHARPLIKILNQAGAVGEKRTFSLQILQRFSILLT